MRRSIDFLKIQDAMLKARPGFEPLKKNKHNPAFKSTDKPQGSKYADLEATIDATLGILTKNGLLLIQSPGRYDETKRCITLTSFLSHTSGEWIEDDFEMPVAKCDPQGVGSALTYARRQSQQALFNLAAEDDDGNKASGDPEKPAIRTPQPLHSPAAPTVHNETITHPQGYGKGIGGSDNMAMPDDMPANDPPKHPPYVKKQGCISEAQSRRIFAIGASRKQSQQQIREHIAAHGFENTNDIPMGEVYNRITSELELK